MFRFFRVFRITTNLSQWCVLFSVVKNPLEFRSMFDIRMVNRLDILDFDIGHSTLIIPFSRAMMIELPNYTKQCSI